jgi:hypothetical protein
LTHYVYIFEEGQPQKSRKYQHLPESFDIGWSPSKCNQLLKIYLTHYVYIFEEGQPQKSRKYQHLPESFDIGMKSEQIRSTA